jgi:hypothetical protein
VSKRSKGAGEPRLTPAKAKNLLGVARVVGPAVLPVVAPYLVKAATTARDGVDRYRARRLGVGVEQLAQFSGRGGALHARITGAQASLADLAERAEKSPDRDDTEDQRRFVDDGQRRLADLATAVRAAERMPAARRRATHKAAAAELDRLEAELLRRLGV